MNSRLKAGIGVLAAIGAVATVHEMTSLAHAQGTPPPPTQGGFGGGGQGGQGGQGGRMRMMGPNNEVAKVTIGDAIKTATGKVSGYVNSATLRPGGPPGPNQKMIWVIHVVTEPGTPPGPGGPGVGGNGGPGGQGGNAGKGENVAVDATTNTITEMPPPPRGFGGPGGGGFGGGGGGQGGGFGGGAGGQGGPR